MKVITDIENYTLTQSCVLTIGTFDGVHVGHQKIIKKLVKQAHKQNQLAVVLTFFPHPRMVLQKDQSLRLIDTMEEKQNHLAALGVDVLVVHPFSKAFSRLTALEFTRDILVNRFHIASLIIGYDHRFGRNREATVEDLIELGTSYDFSVKKIEAQEIASVNVSSTKIRKALEQGDLKIANSYLGRTYTLTGTVRKGNGIGRTLDFRTANLEIQEDYKLLPADGVYFMETSWNNTHYYGMMNIGVRPTVSGDPKHTIEVHLFDFEENIYHQKLSVSILQMIRKEQKFNSLELLKDQLEKDRLFCLEKIKTLNA